MDNRNTKKPDTKQSQVREPLEAIAEDREWEAEQHDQARLEADRDERQDLNQGMQTGTHDSVDPSINWGPEFSLHEKGGKKEQDPK